MRQWARKLSMREEKKVMFYDAAIKCRLSAKLMPTTIFCLHQQLLLNIKKILLTKTFDLANFKSVLGGHEKEDGRQLEAVSYNSD